MANHSDDTVFLTPHFALQEFLYPNAPTPSPDIVTNLTRLAEALEKVRARLGRPIFITSGYRPTTYNLAIGGASRSYHRIGLAADIIVPGLTPQVVQKALADWPGGLGMYPAHTHLDLRPYRARWRGIVSR